MQMYATYLGGEGSALAEAPHIYPQKTVPFVETVAADGGFWVISFWSSGYYLKLDGNIY